jgi:hypothetical protein
MPTRIQDLSSWGQSVATTSGAPVSQHGHASSAFDSRLGRPSRAAQDLDGNWVSKAHDIGQRVDQWRFELSVVCEPGDAIRLAFETHTTPYAVLHDIGGATSKRFLSGVAAAMQTQVRSLTIKRKGYGDTLATLDYVDLATIDQDGRDSSVLRLYTTAVRNADERAVKQVVDVLLAQSLLAVVMINSEVQPGQLAPALAVLKDQMSRPAWRNKSVLMMPLRPMGTLAAQTARMGGSKKIEVRVAPPVVRPLDAWNHLRGSWNIRSREHAEQGEHRVMLLPDPTSVSSSTAVARAAARVAERVASGRATADDLRRYLEGPDAAANTLSSQRYEAPPLAHAAVEAVATRGSFHHSDLRPLESDQVARAPSWSELNAKPAPQSDLAAPVATVPVPLVPPSVPIATQVFDAGKAKPYPQPYGASKLTPEEAATVAGELNASNATSSVPKATTANASWPQLPGTTASQVTQGELKTDLEHFIDQCAQIKGMLHCAVVDIVARNCITQRGQSASMAIESDGTRLVNALRAAALAMQLPGPAGRVPEASMTYEAHHLLVRGLPMDDRLAVVALMNKEDVTPVVVQLKLQRLASALVTPRSNT